MSNMQQFVFSTDPIFSDPAVLLQNVLKVFADFPSPIMDIVKRTDPATVTQHGLYIRPLQNTTPEQGWGKGRISLLGDAAHATIPNGRAQSQFCIVEVKAGSYGVL